MFDLLDYSIDVMQMLPDKALYSLIFWNGFVLSMVIEVRPFKGMSSKNGTMTCGISSCNKKAVSLWNIWTEFVYPISIEVSCKVPNSVCNIVKSLDWGARLH